MPSFGKSARDARLESQLLVDDLAASLESPRMLASWERDLEAALQAKLLRLSLRFPDLIGMFEDGERRHSRREENDWLLSGVLSSSGAD